MTRIQKTFTVLVALVLGLVAGGIGTHTAYWLDSCVASESGGYGMSPDWLNRCRK